MLATSTTIKKRMEARCPAQSLGDSVVVLNLLVRAGRGPRACLHGAR